MFEFLNCNSYYKSQRPVTQSTLFFDKPCSISFAWLNTQALVLHWLKVDSDVQCFKDLCSLSKDVLARVYFNPLIFFCHCPLDDNGGGDAKDALFL